MHRRNQTVLNPQSKAYKSSLPPIMNIEDIGKIVLDNINQKQDQKELSVIEQAEEKFDEKIEQVAKDKVIDQSEVEELKKIIKQMKNDIKILKKNRKSCCC